MTDVSRTSRIPAALIAVILLSALALGGCLRPPPKPSEATPIAESDDFSFEELLTVAPASPSPSPTLVPAGSSTGGSSGGSGAAAKKPAPAPPAPTKAARVHCPSGSFFIELTDFTATKTGTTNDGTPEWTIRTAGQATNNTSRAARDIVVEVTIHTDSADTESESETITGWVGTGTTADWRVEFEYESKNTPKEKDTSAAITRWSWGSGYEQCPTHGSTTE